MQNRSKISNLVVTYYNFSGQERTGSLKDVIPDIASYSVDSFFIPAIFPKLQEQRGFTCGPTALSTALDGKIPARKNGRKNVVSIRQVAKELQVSCGDPIFSVDGLEQVTKYFKIANCKAIITKEDEGDYIKTICDAISTNNRVVAACDAVQRNFLISPANNKGNGPHWILIFGYFTSQNQCYFLIADTNTDRYFICPAKVLFQSNMQLPLRNPYHQQIFGKNLQTKAVRLISSTQFCDLDHTNFKFVTEKTESLERFRLSLLTVPIQLDSFSLALIARDFAHALQLLKAGQIDLSKEDFKNLTDQCRNALGQTFLHYVALNQDKESIKKLLVLGADIHAKNADGKNALGLIFQLSRPHNHSVRFWRYLKPVERVDKPGHYKIIARLQN